MISACGGPPGDGAGDGIGRSPEIRSALTLSEQFVLIQHCLADGFQSQHPHVGSAAQKSQQSPADDVDFYWPPVPQLTPLSNVQFLALGDGGAGPPSSLKRLRWARREDNEQIITLAMSRYEIDVYTPRLQCKIKVDHLPRGGDRNETKTAK